MKKIYAIVLAALLVGCSEQSPQRPSQIKRGAEVAASDTHDLEGEMALMQLNKELAEAADATLHRLATEQTEPYALYEGGVWAHVETVGEGEKPQEGEECTVHMRVMHMDGQLFSDEEMTAVVGKYVFLPAVDKNISEWPHGSSIRMLVPWYSAYGIQGTEQVPSYENVMIELDIR